MDSKEILILIGAAGASYLLFKTMLGQKAYASTTIPQSGETVGWWRGIEGVAIGSEQARLLEEQDAVFYY